MLKSSSGNNVLHTSFFRNGKEKKFCIYTRIKKRDFLFPSEMWTHFMCHSPAMSSFDHKIIGFFVNMQWTQPFSDPLFWKMDGIDDIFVRWICLFIYLLRIIVGCYKWNVYGNFPFSIRFRMNDIRIRWWRFVYVFRLTQWMTNSSVKRINERRFSTRN